MGSQFPDNQDLHSALGGKVEVHYIEAGSYSETFGAELPEAMLEIYFPIRIEDSLQGEKIMGIGEIYRDASYLSYRMAKIQKHSLLAIPLPIGALFLVLTFVLYRQEKGLEAGQKELMSEKENSEQTVIVKTQESLRAQERFKEVSKLATLGTVATAIAHEVNNPLGSIATATEGLLDRSKKVTFRDDPGFSIFVKYLGLIRNEAYLVKDITGKLLGLYRHREAKKQVTDVDTIISEIRPLFSHSKLTKSNLICEHTQLQAYCRPEEVKHILMILLQNSFDAIEETQNGWVKIRARSRGSMVIVEIEDNGVGFEPAYAEKLFEPFFTTKNSKGGTGLGLSICRDLAQAQGGRIGAKSKGMGQGAIFRLYLLKAD